MSTLFAVRSPCTRVGGPRVSTLTDSLSSSSRPTNAILVSASPSTSQSISTVILVHEFHGSAAPLFRQVFAPPVIQRPFGAYTTAHAATAYSRSPKRWSEIHGAVASAVNARDLHAFLEVKKDFSDWIKKQIERARLLEGRDYIIFPQKGENTGRGRSSLEYHLTIEAAKHIAMMSGCFTVPEPTSVILNLVALPSIRAKKNPAKGDPLPGRW